LQRVAGATHLPVKQHPPAAHWLPGQHGSPGPPHLRQVLSRPQPKPLEQAGVVAVAGQQASPAPPQRMQRLSWQVWPGPQVAV
jgi:hypothetical protein